MPLETMLKANQGVLPSPLFAKTRGATWLWLEKSGLLPGLTHGQVTTILDTSFHLFKPDEMLRLGSMSQWAEVEEFSQSIPADFSSAVLAGSQIWSLAVHSTTLRQPAPAQFTSTKTPGMLSRKDLNALHLMRALIERGYLVSYDQNKLRRAMVHLLNSDTKTVYAPNHFREVSPEALEATQAFQELYTTPQTQSYPNSRNGWFGISSPGMLKEVARSASERPVRQWEDILQRPDLSYLGVLLSRAAAENQTVAIDTVLLVHFNNQFHYSPTIPMQAKAEQDGKLGFPGYAGYCGGNALFAMMDAMKADMLVKPSKNAMAIAGNINRMWDKVNPQRIEEVGPEEMRAQLFSYLESRRKPVQEETLFHKPKPLLEIDAINRHLAEHKEEFWNEISGISDRERFIKTCGDFMLGQPKIRDSIESAMTFALHGNGMVSLDAGRGGDDENDNLHEIIADPSESDDRGARDDQGEDVYVDLAGEEKATTPHIAFDLLSDEKIANNPNLRMLTREMVAAAMFPNDYAALHDLAAPPLLEKDYAHGYIRRMPAERQAPAQRLVSLLKNSPVEGPIPPGAIIPSATRAQARQERLLAESIALRAASVIAVTAHQR